MVGAILEIFLFTRRKFTGSWIAVGVFMMVVCGPTYSLAGDLCIGTTVALDKGEVVVRCPLTENVKATRHSVLIKHCADFSDPDPKDDKGTAFECHWPTEEAEKPDCMSSFNFSLVGQLTDQILAKLPVSMLMVKGTYKAQLFPSASHKTFTTCDIYRFSGTGEVARSAATPAPAGLLSGTENHSVETQEPQKKEIPACEGQGQGEKLSVAILVLQLFTIIFLGVYICLQLRNKQSGKEEQDRQWMFCGQFNCAKKRHMVPTTDNPPGNGRFQA